MRYLILIFLSSTVFARYYEKTRFDRSVHNEDEIWKSISNNLEKQWSFTDDVTQFIAYKSRKENDCYLENIKYDLNVSQRKKRQSKIFYASTILTKLEAWRLAGGRIVDFCKGRNIILLQTTRPIPGQTLNPFLNEIPVDENDILPKRVADVVLTPLVERTRRQIQLENRERLNKNFHRIRLRRQTNQFRGKFRGQTQTQYLNLGSGEQKEGKAEAEATQQSSHAVVSGSRGMGQAQSMSSGGTGCEDCPGYPGYRGIEGVPDKFLVPPANGERYAQSPVPSAGVTPGVTRPGVGVVGGPSYPGEVIPGERITYTTGVVPSGVGIYPGILPETRPGPEGVQPGTVTPGGDRMYPAGIQPGVIRPGGDGTYPASVQPGVARPRGDRIYPGGVQPGIIRPGGDGIYPAGVQPGVARPEGEATYPGSIQPGIVSPGSVRPGITTLGDGIYPGVVRPGDDRIYPPGAYITRGPGPYPGTIQPERILPGIPTTEIRKTGTDTYPDGIQPGIQPQATYLPGIMTSVTTGTTVIGTGAYPGGIAPGTSLPIGTYPGTRIRADGDQFGAIPGTITGTYPGSIISKEPAGQEVYPAAGQQTRVPYPGGIAPGTLPGRAIAYPTGPAVQVPSMVTSTGSVIGAGMQITYPAGQQIDGQAVYPGGIIHPGRVSEGTGGAPSIIYPAAGTYPGRDTVPTTYPTGSQPQVVHPAVTQQAVPPSGTLYPGQSIYPGSQVTTYPGTSYPGPGVVVPGTGVTGGTIIPGGAQYLPGTIGSQIGGIGVTGVTDGQYPGQYPSLGGIDDQRIGVGPMKPYPGISGTEEPSQYTRVGVSGPVSVADDGAESQASSSVQQLDSGTQASASAQGKYGQGTAQSQVTGTYSGSGTFSAQAGSSDAIKSAQAEISGGKKGATSNAQGVAGYGKSQAQVQLDSDSGATSTGAQSSGWNHGTNSQVQASSKGGMADAQANGEGSTSSQAQIGFQPYLKNDEELEKHAIPFRGSGTASAQSGTHRGQSQSQLQGSFQYGITYSGAAQAGSGSGAAASRKPFNFSVTDTDLFKPFKPQDPLSKQANVGTIQSGSSEQGPNYKSKQDNREQGLQSSSTSRQTVIVNTKDNLEESTADKKVSATEKPKTDDAIYDEYEDEYADEYYDTTMTSSPLLSSNARAITHQRSKFNKTAPQQNHQTQTMHIVKGNQYDVHVSQDTNTPRTGSILQPGQSLPSYTIPSGFRGKVTSISGTETIAQGDGKSQSQTVSLVPKNSNIIKPITETRSLQTNHERHVDRYIVPTVKNQTSSVTSQTFLGKQTKPTPSSVAMKPSYYTVTNSVAGKMNGSNTSRKYEHRYYTKSSTCGYFTFSCNVVYGSNGRTKICKPKVPTYPDGTPMRC